MDKIIKKLRKKYFLSSSSSSLSSSEIVYSHFFHSSSTTNPHSDFIFLSFSPPSLLSTVGGEGSVVLWKKDSEMTKEV
jgi:hypothetical protein